jgi:hypothetical protein
MMEAVSTSETSVSFYQTTQRNNPEDSHLHTVHKDFNVAGARRSDITKNIAVY